MLGSLRGKAVETGVGVGCDCGGAGYSFNKVAKYAADFE